MARQNRRLALEDKIAPKYFFLTHAAPQMGKGMGLLGLAATNPRGFRETMDGYKLQMRF